MTRPHRGSWRWKVRDGHQNPRLDLLYEPGNWGDVLKGAWAILTAEALIRNGAGATFRLLDPFAGAPHYPLVASAKERLAALALGTGAAKDLAAAQEPHASQGHLASTAILISEAVSRRGLQPELHVYDLDAQRAESWKAVPQARLLEADSGESVVRRWREFQPLSLLLVDPYDLFDRFGPLLERGLEAAAELPVLFYLYNKAPRGGGHDRAYKSFREALERRAPKEAAILLGRIPSDVFLPRAYHEMILAAPRPFVKSLEPELADCTRSLSRALSDDGAFESIPGEE